MNNPAINIGFIALRGRGPGGQSRAAEFTAIAGLAVSTVIALTVITVGVANAGVGDGIVDNEGGIFTIALLLGLIFIGIGGLSILPTKTRRHRH